MVEGSLPARDRQVLSAAPCVADSQVGGRRQTCVSRVNPLTMRINPYDWPSWSERRGRPRASLWQRELFVMGSVLAIEEEELREC